MIALSVKGGIKPSVKNTLPRTPKGKPIMVPKRRSFEKNAGEIYKAIPKKNAAYKEWLNE